MESTKFWAAQGIDAKSLFCPDRLSKIDTHRVSTFKKGDFIYLKNENNQNIFLIEHGRVKIGVYGAGNKEIIKAIVEEGELFGELAFIDGIVGKEFAQALEYTELCTISMQELHKLFTHDSDVRKLILGLLGNRIVSLENRLERMAFKDSKSRIIDFLLELADQKGERVGYEIVVRRFLTHQEIASLTATSRQTVTTVLNKLRSHDIITFDRKRLLIRDRNKLASLLSR